MDSTLKVLPAFNPCSSSSTEEEETIDNTKIKRKRGKGRPYEQKQTFISRETACNFIKEQGISAKKNLSKSEEGDKVYYRCNKVPISADPCPACIAIYN